MFIKYVLLILLFITCNDCFIDQENILQSHFKQQDYIYGEKMRPLFEMAGPKLSLKVPPNSGSNWLMEQHTVRQIFANFILKFIYGQGRNTLSELTNC